MISVSRTTVAGDRGCKICKTAFFCDQNHGNVVDGYLVITLVHISLFSAPTKHKYQFEKYSIHCDVSHEMLSETPEIYMN